MQQANTPVDRKNEGLKHRFVGRNKIALMPEGE
jgi:hypothetical protein